MLSVLGFHFFPNWLPGGYVGVDIFFVISGFLITHRLLVDLTLDRFHFWSFWGARIRRIFPAVILVAATSLIFGWFALWASEFAQLGKHIASGGAFFVNFVFVNEHGYFDNSGYTKPMLHLWSLSVEEQFYIFWPITIFLAWKIRLNLVTVFLFLIVLSFGYSFQIVDKNPTGNFFWPWGRIWEFLFGGLLAWLLVHKNEKLYDFAICVEQLLIRAVTTNKFAPNGVVLSDVISFVALFMLLFAVFCLDKTTPFPSVWTAIPTTGAALIIAAGSKSHLNQLLFSNKIAVLIGLISFPLYLWHWPILSFSHIVGGVFPDRSVRIIGVVISLLLAWMTYQFIEKPVKKSGLKSALACLLVGSMAFTVFAGWYIYSNGGLKERSFIAQKKLADAEFGHPLWKYTRNEICKNNFWLPEADEWGWFFCSQSKDRPPNVILLGDSYANQYYPGFVMTNALNHNSFLSLGTCNGLDVLKASNEADKYRKSDNPCFGNNAFLQERHLEKIIQNEKSLQFAILTVARSNLTAEHFDWLMTRIRLLKRHDIEIVLFQPHLRPSPAYNIKSCYSRPFSNPIHDCVLDPDRLSAADEEFNQLINKINSLGEKILTFNPNLIFCKSDGQCSFLLADSMPAFRDEYFHFSEFASKKLIAKHFIPWTEENLPSLLNKTKPM